MSFGNFSLYKTSDFNFIYLFFCSRFVPIQQFAKRNSSEAGQEV